MDSWENRLRIAYCEFERCKLVPPPGIGPAMIRQAPYLRTNSIATAPLFSREGGSPDWVPAFAGKHACGPDHVTAAAPRRLPAS